MPPEDGGGRPGGLVVGGVQSVASRKGHVPQALDLTLGRRGGGGSMSNPLTHVATRSAGVIVGAPSRGTELGMERVLEGRYKIEEPLGVGGSSQVYLARDQALNRDVALKVLDAPAAADGNTRRMFVKEARALAQLSHPNIVAVYDVGEVDGSPFIAMDNL